MKLASGSTVKVFRKYTRGMTMATPSTTVNSTCYSLRTMSPTIKIHTPLTQRRCKKNSSGQLHCQNCTELSEELKLSCRKNEQLTHELLNTNREIQTLKAKLNSAERNLLELGTFTEARLSTEHNALTSKVQDLEAAILSTTPQSITTLCEGLRSDFSVLECSYLSILAQNRALSTELQSLQAVPALDSLLFSN